MLGYMRQRSRSVIIYLFFGIIIVVFVINFGPQSRGCQRSAVSLAAKVNGDEVDTFDLRSEYIRRYGTATSRKLDDESYLARRRDTLQNLVNMALLAQEARRLGFVVTREELAEHIKDPKRNPDYRSLEVDGKFNVEQYRRLVRGLLQTSMERYERFRSWELLASKLLEHQRSLIRVSASELKEAYRQRETKVNLEFVAVRPSDQKVDETVTPEALEQYGAAHEEEIGEYYEKHQRDYDKPRQVRIRQVFLRSPSSDEAGDRAAARKKAEDLRQKIIEGADMVEIARTHSDHLSYKAKGGDMGWQSEGNNDPAFDAAAFVLEKGALSEVVETQAGYFLLRAEDIKPAFKKTRQDATPEIAETLLLEERRKQAASKIALAMLAALQEGGRTLQDAAKAASAHGEEKEEEERDAAGDAASVLYTVQETGYFSQEGKAGGFSPESAFSFARPWDQVPRIGRSKEISMAAFALTEEARVPAKVFEVNGAWYVLRLKERTGSKEEIPEEDRSRLLAELRRSKERKIMGEWESALFFPPSRRVFGPAPTLGPWTRRLLDRLGENATIYRNEALYTSLREPGGQQEGDAVVGTGEPEAVTTEPADDAPPPEE